MVEGGGMAGWQGRRVEGREAGKMKAGKMVGWKDGSMEGWKDVWIEGCWWGDGDLIKFIQA